MGIFGRFSTLPAARLGWPRGSIHSLVTASWDICRQDGNLDDWAYDEARLTAKRTAGPA